MADCYCDYDPPSAFAETTRKAKKVHKCDECSGSIVPGESYRHTWGVWDGDVQVFKRCPDCADLMRWAEAHVKCICWTLGNAHEELLETMDQYDSECPGIYAEAKAKVKAVRTKRRSPAEM